MKRHKHSRDGDDQLPAKTAGMLFGLIFGAGVGMSLGALFLNNPTSGIAFGAAAGLATGLAAGYVIESRLKGEHEPSRDNSAEDRK